MVLRGELNRTQDILVDTWCFLLLPGQTSLTGWFTLSNKKIGTASFAASEKEKPEVVGLTLTQLGSYWRPYHIWMVEDGPESWTEQVFYPSDAIEEPFVGTNGKTWRRLTKAPSGSLTDSSSRIVAVPSTFTIPAISFSSQIVPGGWDHEHCSLCNTHIDPDDRFFYSLKHCEFLCVPCYERYVPERDIAFAFE